MTLYGKKDQEGWLRARYAEGEYYEAVGVAEEASSKEILMALVERRREYPALDDAWNAMHAALLQHRELYDGTRALCDLLSQEIADGCPFDVRRRFSKSVLWKRLWNPDDPPDFLLVRLEIQREAAEWVRVERAFAEARRQLAQECGEAVFALLDQTTNWQQVRERPETPAEFEQFILQMIKTARSSAAELPALEINPSEVSAGQAKRAFITKMQCLRCGGTHRVRWGLSEIASQWDTFLEQHPEIQNLPPERLALLLQGAAVEGPCPECTGQVIFTVPKGVRVGWVLQGRGTGDKAHFARVGTISTRVLPLQPTVRPTEAPSQPLRTAWEWLVFLIGCIVWSSLAYLFGKSLVALAASRAQQHSFSAMQIAGLVGLALVLFYVAVILWSLFSSQNKK